MDGSQSVDEVTPSVNEQLVLISGESATGKSASLMSIPNQEKWMYLNCEAGKRLPFRNKFDAYTITDPYQVHQAFEYAQDNPDVHGIIVDTITFMMEMFESVYINGAANGQAAWGQYFQFWKRLLQHHVANSDKPVIMLGHTRTDYNESTLSNDTAVPVKGALRGNGLEAYFSTVVSTKKVPLKELEGQDSSLLHITEEDQLVGYKHVFQTRLTKKTIGERIRSPMGMFKPNQTYIDNDAYMLLQHLSAYYD